MISLIRDNCDFLKQGIDLLERHSPQTYAKSDSNAFGSSIGSHMRHVLDHYGSFLSGLETGLINYDERERDTRIETDLAAGIARSRSLLTALTAATFDRDSLVDVIVSANTRYGDDRSRSTFGRELQFLASHTVHHYALIAIASRMQGIPPNEEFGIAPSTLKYLQTVDC